MSARLRRLRKLERKIHGGETLLTLPNGKKIALRIRDSLGLLCTAWDRSHCIIEGKPQPVNPKHDPALNLLKIAVALDEGADNLIVLAFNALHHRTQGEILK